MNPNMPVRGMSPHTAVHCNQPKPSAYPRSGSASSLMYRCPSERLGAHRGYGRRVSVCATPRTLLSSELHTTQPELKESSKLVAVQQPAPPMEQWQLHRSPQAQSAVVPGVRTLGRRIIIVPDAGPGAPWVPQDGRRPSIGEPRRSVSADTLRKSVSVEVHPPVASAPSFAASPPAPRGQELTVRYRGVHSPRAIPLSARSAAATVAVVDIAAKPRVSNDDHHLPSSNGKGFTGRSHSILLDPSSLAPLAGAERRPSGVVNGELPEAQVIATQMAERASFVEVGAPRMSILADPSVYGMSATMPVAMATERAEVVPPAPGPWIRDYQ